MPNTRERIAEEIAERIGTVRRYAGKRPHYYWNEQFEIKLRHVLDSLLAAERAGKIVFVTDDVAVFKFPIPTQEK